MRVGGGQAGCEWRSDAFVKIETKFFYFIFFFFWGGGGSGQGGRVGGGGGGSGWMGTEK